MLEMRLRGYVTPEDFTGTDTERIQKALDTSAEYDIGRVVLKGNYKVDTTLRIHPMTDLVMEDACVAANGDFPVLENWNLKETEKHSYSFEEKFFTVRGNNAKLDGDVVFYNANHVNIDGLEFGGALCFSFTREVRLFNSTFTGKNGAVLAMGANNFIMQNLIAHCADSAVVMDPTLELADYLIGKEADVHDVILQDSAFHTVASAITLRTDAECKISNIQISNIQADGTALTVGTKEIQVPENCYFNLTAEGLTAGGEKIVVNNPVKHCYFPG